MPTVPTVPADQLPTLEIPRSTFPRDLDRGGERRDLDVERRSPVETAEASGRPEFAADASPFETAATSSSPGSPLEISETQAAILFDVSAPVSTGGPSSGMLSAESLEPHEIPEPLASVHTMREPAFDRETEETEAEEIGLAASEREAEARPEPVQKHDEHEIAPHEAPSAPAPVPAPSEPAHAMEAETHAAVPGDIEMLAQRSSIPELTQMLSSMRATGDISDEQLDRLAAKVVEKLSDKVVREIAWEVIPDMAEIVIRQRIKELEAGVE
jgi:hypothetical protein